MNKRDLTERDICTKFITPAVAQAGWDLLSQVREEVAFTKGRIIVRGKLVTRGKANRADYILYYKPNIPLALIEAKDNQHSVGAGMLLVFSILTCAPAIAQISDVEPAIEDSESSAPGEYKIIARNLRDVVNPGDEFIIEIYVTGFGRIGRNKMLIYESNNVMDYDKSTCTTFGGKQVTQFKSLGIVLHLSEKSFEKAPSDTLEKPDRSDLPMLVSEKNRKGAPIQLNLRTKENVNPGIYSMDIHFTYFNGNEWRVSQTQARFKVQNVFEKHQGKIAVLGIIVALISIVKLLEYLPKLIVLFKKWL